MAFSLSPLVRETSASTGTGSFALAGAPTGYRTFASALNVGDTTWYFTVNAANPAQWEEGIGTLTAASTLARTTILSSSNDGSAVAFSAGTKDIRCTPSSVMLAKLGAISNFVLGLLSSTTAATFHSGIKSDDTYGRLDGNNTGPFTTAGTGSAYTATIQAGQAAHVDGRRILLKFHTVGAGGATTLVLKPSGGSNLASKPIKRMFGGVELNPFAGDIQAQIAEVVYDASAGGSGAYILLDPQARPGLYAHKNNTDQNFSNTTAVKLTFPTEDFDVGAIYDVATSRIQPPFPCRLNIETTLRLNVGAADQTSHSIYYRKNGTDAGLGVSKQSGGDPMTAYFSQTVSFNGTSDYLEIWFLNDAAGSKTVDGGKVGTFLQASLA